MEQLVGILVKVLLFAFVAGMFTLVFVVSRRGRKQTEQVRDEYAQLRRLAPERGWTYTAHTQGRIDQYFGVGPFPRSGGNLSAFHYTTGEFRGRSFTYFEYRYNNPMSGGEVADRKQLIVESVFVVKAPGSGPKAEIYRPGRLDALMDRRTKIQLGVPEFDEKFSIATTDEAAVRDLLGGDLVPFLLSDPRAEDSPVALRGDDLFTWYTGTLSPQAVDERLNYLCDVLERIPTRAWTAA
ncbi:hypothetical protein K4B79_38020 [Streptomyces lincolnensis]|uniref:hypothetical protein n=1 Tax=Streptomyces lincolnensis TaxID=1915 RepID=UPI001E3D483A|nr:hypothetical protein [Streptomyces lincolnensis]MCD7443994.1 hypothetical protein [Streptomyces lincolnensis]